MAYQLSYGPRPDDLEVCHSCHNRLCCNPEHLSLGTHQDNEKRKQQADRGARKLTRAQVICMRQEHACGGITYAALARKNGVTQAMARFVVIRKSWPQVPYA